MTQKLADVHPTVLAKLLADAAHQANYGLSPGAKAINVLHASGVVANGETVTIDGQVFEVDIINTDTGINTSGGEWNNTTDAILVTMAAHGKAAGDLLRVENEIFKVLRVPDANSLVLARGRSGTTPATHADALDIFESDAAPASNIPVGLVTTLTAAVFTDALVDEINNAVTTGNKERATAKASTLYNTIVASGPVDAEVLIQGINPGVLALACTETGTNLAWSAATMYGGQAAGHLGSVAVARVPTATEVAAGVLRVVLPFTPKAVDVQVRVTATGVVKAWDGALAIVSGGFTLDNGGVTDWAATDTVFAIAHE